MIWLSKKAGFVLLLDDMGLIKGRIHEAILTTVNRDGSYNPAPMGVTRAGPETLELRPFKSSATYGNLKRNQRACVNVTDDPGLFLTTAFKEADLHSFRPPTIDDEMRLKDAEAHIFIRTSKSQDISEDRASFICLVEGIEAEYMRPKIFSRGKAEAIEAVIHATRIEVFSKEGKLGEVERLIRLSAECKDVIERVSKPGSVEVRVIRELERMIASWRDAG